MENGHLLVIGAECPDDKLIPAHY